MPEYLEEKGLIVFGKSVDIKEQKKVAKAAYKSDTNYLFDDYIYNIGLPDINRKGKVDWDCTAVIEQIKRKNGIVDTNKINVGRMKRGSKEGGKFREIPNWNWKKDPGFKTVLNWNDGEQRNGLMRLLLLHKVLKNCRNQCNHAADKKDRVDLAKIKELIEGYLKLAEKLVDDTNG